MPTRSPPPILSPLERQDILVQQIARCVTLGARVEAQGPYNASIVRGEPVNHVLHFLIGALTCGAWWLVWAFLGVRGGADRTTIVVDEYGAVRYVGTDPQSWKPQSSKW
jgi:hypothetical protein